MLCLLFSGISFALDVLVAHVVIRPDSGRDEAIERMGIIYSNCAFIGIPLVEGVLGKEGVFYVTAYLTVFNTLVWTHGVSLMRGKGTLRESLGHLNTPTIYAIGLGLLLFFSQIRFRPCWAVRGQLKRPEHAAGYADRRVTWPDRIPGQ